jgi:hypothetical protein
MSASLAEKIRIARHNSVEVNGITFNYCRPTDIQMAELFQEFNGEHNRYEIVKRFVFGWNGLKESDLIPDGADDPAKFEAEVFAEWLADARDFWTPIYEAVMTSYVERSADREEEIKN